MVTNYTREFLEPVIQQSKSIADVLRYLGIEDYNVIYRHLRKFEFDTSHFMGSGWSKGLTAENSTSVKTRVCKTRIWSPETGLVLGTKIQGSRLRQLLKEIGRVDVCEKCSLATIWQGNKIVLQVDHINGNKYDNRPENLRILCPNCHSQTETFGTKNKHKYCRQEYIDNERSKLEQIKEERAGRERLARPRLTPKRMPKLIRPCETCGSDTTRDRYCSWECIERVKKCPLSVEEIKARLDANDGNFLKTGKELGVSDNAIRHRLKRAGLL